MNITRELPLVLQLDIIGNPQKWITHEDSAYHYSKDNVGWAMGAVEFDLHGGTCAATGKQSILTINTIIAIKGNPNVKAMRHYRRVPLTNRTLFRRDQNICAYCGNIFSVSHLTRDHIIPTSRNGTNKWTNVVTACAPCNKEKDNKLLKETNMSLIYIPYAPNRSEWLLLQNRKILTDQMEFLMKRIPKVSRLHEHV